MPFSKKHNTKVVCNPIKQIIPRIINITRHDTNIFTQGLCYERGFLYESGGGYGSSSLTKYDYTSGDISEQIYLPSKIFAEGITVIGNSIIMLTWKSKRGFIYNKDTLQYVNSFNLPTNEGWGITFNGKHIIISDGSSTLYFLDSHSYKIMRKITVTKCGLPVRNLNELSYRDNKIYANVWGTDKIVVIDPKNGRVIEDIILTDIVNENITYGVLNGSTWVPSNSGAYCLLITGKKWPKMYLLDDVSKIESNNSISQSK